MAGGPRSTSRRPSPIQRPVQGAAAGGAREFVADGNGALLGLRRKHGDPDQVSWSEPCSLSGLRPCWSQRPSSLREQVGDPDSLFIDRHCRLEWRQLARTSPECS